MRAIELHWDEDHLALGDDSILTNHLAHAILWAKNPPVLLWNHKGSLRRIPLELLENMIQVFDDYMSRNRDRPFDNVPSTIGVIRLDDLGPPLIEWKPVSPNGAKT